MANVDDKLQPTSPACIASISARRKASTLLTSQPPGFFDFLAGISSMSDRREGRVSLHDIAKLVLTPDVFRHRRYPTTQAAVMTISE